MNTIADDASNGTGGTSPSHPPSNTSIFCRGGDHCVDALKSCSPTRKPLAWLFLNAIWFTLSAFIIFLVCLHPLSPAERFARQCYLIYNLLTTLTWVVEVYLPMLDQDHFWKVDWKALLELTLAVYFMIDSVVVVAKWKMKHNHTDYMLLDLVVNAVAYSFAAVKVWKLRRRHQEGFRAFNQDAVVV